MRPQRCGSFAAPVSVEHDAAAATAACSWPQPVFSSANAPMTACSWRCLSKSSGGARPALTAFSSAATTEGEGAEATEWRKYADARSQSSFEGITTPPLLLRDCGRGSGALIGSARKQSVGMALGELTNSTLEAKIVVADDVLMIVVAVVAVAADAAVAVAAVGVAVVVVVIVVVDDVVVDVVVVCV